MACGVPAVTTDVGGLPEVNIHGHSGYTAPLGDVDAMADRVLDILGDAATHARFRAGALAQARRFDLRQVLPRYEALYEQVLSAQPA